jgi:serine/threonine protein phosphatase PrpC
MTLSAATGKLNVVTIEGAAACSDCGLLRPVNEDTVLLREWPDAGGAVLAAVADGMGSYGGGDTASSIVTDSFAALLREPLPSDPVKQCELLLAAFYHADERIREMRGKSYPEMGATAVAAIIMRNSFVHLYAGDCRLYLLRKGEIVYRTHDHSAVQVLIDSGRISAEEARNHQMRSMVTSCLGGPNVVGRLTVDPPLWIADDGEPDWTKGPFRKTAPGDRIILCSDGLWAEIGDEGIVSTLRGRARNMSTVVNKLVNLANRAGGSDNISVIAVAVRDKETAARTQSPVSSTSSSAPR